MNASVLFRFCKAQAGYRETGATSVFPDYRALA
ncbi:hypothetical protein LCGC14_1833470, partial [marine sediment metagenome]